MITVRRLPLVPIQCALFAATLCVFALSPPPRGPMLLVALDGSGMGTTLRLARSAGAALIAAGPLPGSLIVMADRGALSRLLAGTRIVILAAPSSLCGSEVAK